MSNVVEVKVGSAKSRSKWLGYAGECLVRLHLERMGFRLICSNYTTWGGEIDLILDKDGKIHFVEVKTVTRETSMLVNGDVIRETLDFRPEELLSPKKISFLQRTIIKYLSETDENFSKEWQLDLAIVYISHKNKMSYIKFIKDIVVEE